MLFHFFSNSLLEIDDNIKCIASSKDGALSVSQPSDDNFVCMSRMEMNDNQARHEVPREQVLFLHLNCHKTYIVAALIYELTTKQWSLETNQDTIKK